MEWHTPEYKSYRSGFTFRDIYEILKLEQTEGKRRHITRHTILGKWHEIKLKLYTDEKEFYAAQ